MTREILHTSREKSVIFAGRTSYDILIHYKVNLKKKKKSDDCELNCSHSDKLQAFRKQAGGFSVHASNLKYSILTWTTQ